MTLSNQDVGISHALNWGFHSGLFRRSSRSHSKLALSNGTRTNTGSGLLRLKMTGICPCRQIAFSCAFVKSCGMDNLVRYDLWPSSVRSTLSALMASSTTDPRYRHPLASGLSPTVHLTYSLWRNRRHRSCARSPLWCHYAFAGSLRFNLACVRQDLWGNALSPCHPP